MGNRFGCCLKGCCLKALSRGNGKQQADEAAKPKKDFKQVREETVPTNVQMADTQRGPLEINLMLADPTTNLQLDADADLPSPPPATQPATKTAEPISPAPTLPPEPVSSHNLDSKINEAVGLRSQPAVVLWQEIIAFISNSPEKDFQMVEKLAYSEANLAALYAQSGNPLSETHYKAALSIYGHYENDFIEEIVAILNNMALQDEAKGQFGDAIKRYQNVQSIQDKYYSIGDSRRLLAENNLACAYCQNKQFKEGLDTFTRLMEVVGRKDVDPEIAHLIRNNFQFYQRNQ